MQYVPAEIVSNTELAPRHWLLELQVPAPLPPVTAGQFLNLRCDPSDRHSLLRPFSILGSDEAQGRLSVYYKHLGRLSVRLSEMPVGTELDCLYPLGQGFSWQPEWRRVALVGGGVGLAPLLYWAQQLQARDPDVQPVCFLGGGTESDLVPALLERYELPLELATMDGSRGHHGTVVELFSGRSAGFDALYSCGPNPMMAALKQVLPDGMPAYASLEELMACGVGACYGCTARVVTGGAEQNLRVCREGPVFDLHSVVFGS